ncbi:MAG: hypothetical protein FJ344_07645 [Sphingomonadales bacterium]|nr:hypothetical protein [Sphingomonadales bacterium]
MVDFMEWRELGSKKLFHSFFFDQELVATTVFTPLKKVTSEETDSLSWTDKVVLLLHSVPSDSQKVLLDKILVACGLLPQQIFTQTCAIPIESIDQFVGARLILSFGALIGVDPDHQIHELKINTIPCLSLDRLESDASAKKLLWNSLKSTLLS